MITDWKLGKPMPQGSQPHLSGFSERDALNERDARHEFREGGTERTDDPRVRMSSWGFASPVGRNPYTSIPISSIKGPELRDNSVTSAKIESITSKTITGGTIQTNTAGERVRMLETSPDRIEWLETDGSIGGHLLINGGAELMLESLSDNDLVLKSGVDLILTTTGANDGIIVDRVATFESLLNLKSRPTNPATPPLGYASLYWLDNGAGTRQLRIKLDSGGTFFFNTTGV